MRILLLIDGLGSGGAQRQIVYLANELASLRHQVLLLTYSEEREFFGRQIDSAQVERLRFRKKNGFSFRFLLALIRIIQERKIEAVIAYLPAPSLYALAAKALLKSFKLVVSERTSQIASNTNLNLMLSQRLYRLADAVVCNSLTQSNHIRNRGFSTNVYTIYNGYPAIMGSHTPKQSASSTLRILVVGRITGVKNGVRIARALKVVRERSGRCPIISWAGRLEEEQEAVSHYKQINSFLSDNPGVKSNWHWLGEVADVVALYQAHDVLLHVSLYEGLPNAVCEAMLGGLPVIVSDVCDHSDLAGRGSRAMLVDPHSADDIASGILRFIQLGIEERRALADRAKEYAVETFSVHRMAQQYVEVLGGED